ISAQGGLGAGVDDLTAVLGEVYPELADNRDLIERTLRQEESAFEQTIGEGLKRLESVLSGGAGTVSGEDAFRLYDTHGVPLELMVEIAAERGAGVDTAGFAAAMEQQRARSQAAVRRSGFSASALPPTRFVGYDTLEADSVVAAVAPGDEIAAGQAGDVVLDVSPFYARAGGQVGDSGTLSWDAGEAVVLDTEPVPGSDSRLHRVEVRSGALRPGQGVHAAVDPVRRGAAARHHSATHLLNRALREVLGEGIVQRGSFVGPDHTTFDFSFPRALSREEIAAVEQKVNDAIRRDLQRTAELMALPDARASGAIALLDEAYSDSVRVVDFGGWSRELCGGTHVGRSGEIGAAIIVDESSIGQGIRRITMVAGAAAERRWREVGDALQAAARALKAPPAEVPARVRALQEQVRNQERELRTARHSAPVAAISTAAAVLEDTGPFRFAHLMLDDGDVRDVVDRLFSERLQGDGVAAAIGPRQLAVKVGGGALAAGVDAGTLVRQASERTGARGGGRKEFAQGGVGDPARRADALDTIRGELLRRAA
ncbi:MAG: alanine--tRNA ligase, partial [Candidatus Dormibacteraeota bacterium]|nr:alanine--tRNA ligase [Candidatus Dormibacteraeota bacterium]